MKPYVLFLALVLISSSVASAPFTPPPGLMVLPATPAPPLRLKDSDNRETDLARLRGQWVLVHFWASWCGPCRKEMPTLQRMTQKLPATSLRLVLINTAETDDEVFSFLASVAPDLESLMDRDGKVTALWNPRGLPSSFLVDPQGKIRYLALGGRSWDTPVYLDFLRKLSNRPIG